MNSVAVPGAARVVWAGCAVLALGLACLAMPVARASTLDPAVLPNVEAATFEVVAAKPTHDPLSYAEPLPMNLIPYQQRTDDYRSIGTAFAIGPNRYVTAGHVLRTGLNSLWGPLELRDSKGHVYAIGKIEKFSLRKDFVVFSLKDPPKHNAVLPIDTDPVVNQKVYAVGNALGTGVVIRGGLYTSRTPENQSGAWKWLRFSAAASPGNSGGPLLDKHGKVIGVVLMKSPDENLNYALPIGQVLNAPDHEAVIDKRIPYGFDLIQDTHTGTFKARFKLPMSLAAFNATFLKLRHAYVDRQLKAILADNATSMFPHGEGSARMLYGLPWTRALPAFLVRGSNGVWHPSVHRGPKLHLDDHGYLRLGKVGHNLLFHLRAPDNVSPGKLHHDPEKFMNLVAASGILKRHVASAKVKITSLGKPMLQQRYTDAWQRHWQVMAWPMPYMNQLVVVFALPVPDGYVGFMRQLPVSREHDYLINLEAMTDYFYANYSGTLPQWQAFLKNPRLLPAAFKHIHMDIDYGKSFRYRSDRVGFAVTSRLQKIDAHSELGLEFGFFHDHGKVVWGVSDIVLLANLHDHNAVSVVRMANPAGDPDAGYHNSWKKMLHGRPPYDAVARDDGDVTKITGVSRPQGHDKPAVMYVAEYDVEGKQSQAVMKSGLDTLMQNLHVHEHL